MIKFGRVSSNGVNIVFKEDSTSRCQCKITFNEGHWQIVDSDGTKKSLNGTWYLADEYTQITNGMYIRAGTTTFACQIVKT